MNIPFLVAGEKIVRKKLKPGAIPTLNMPKKSHPRQENKERKQRTIVQDYFPIKQAYYKDFEDLKNKLMTLKSLSEWDININEHEVVLNVYHSIMLKTENSNDNVEKKRCNHI